MPPGLSYLVNWQLRVADNPFVTTAGGKKRDMLISANAFWVVRGRPNETMNARLYAYLFAAWEAQDPSVVRFIAGGSPGQFLPATAPIPTAAELVTMHPPAVWINPMTPWPVGDYVVTSDGKHMSWTGFEWLEVAPPVLTYAQVVLADNPVGYWRLDDASGSVAANLGSGGVPGSYISGPGLADVAHWAPRTPAAVADGLAVTLVTTFPAASFVEIPPGPFGAIEFSFEMWFRVPASHGAVPGILLQAIGANPQINLQLIVNENGSLAAHRRNAAGAIASLSAPPVTREVWHHVVYRRIPGVSLALYLDAVQVATTADTVGGMAIANAPVTVGGDPTGTNFVNGMIDEVAVYATALTLAQITAHYAARGPTPPPSSPLLTGLVSYWKLNEASGVRADAHGTNPLTPTNAPVGAPGKIGNGCDFELDSAQSLHHADPNPLGDEDFTYTLWFKREALTAVRNQLIAKDSTVGRCYRLELGGEFLTFWLGNDKIAELPPSVTNNTDWHFLAAWHDAVANTATLQLDNGVEHAYPTGGVFPPVFTTPVYIGAREYTGYEDYFDGVIDEVGLWRRVLTPEERTELYNAGAGLTYPF